MLKDITVGRYIDTGSVLHRLDARTKLLSVLVYSTAVLSADSLCQMAVIAAFTLLCVFISKLPIMYIIKGLKPIAWFMVFTALINILTVKGEPVFEWGIILITSEGVKAAVKVVLRLAFFITGASLLTLTTPPIALTDGLSRLMSPLKLIKLPVDDIAMIISVSLRFISIFADEAERIKKAQAARGADFCGRGIISKLKAILPLTIPLFLSVWRHADELSAAMESRCYGKGVRRPRKKSHFKTRDLLAGVIMVVFVIACC